MSQARRALSRQTLSATAFARRAAMLSSPGTWSSGRLLGLCQIKRNSISTAFKTKTNNIVNQTQLRISKEYILSEERCYLLVAQE